MARLARHRFHLIEAGRYTSVLKPDSKALPDWGLLTYLHGAGRSEAGKWIEKHLNSVGRRSSVDFQKRYLKVGQGELPAPATSQESPVQGDGVEKDLQPVRRLA